MPKAELEMSWRFEHFDARIAHEHRHVLMSYIRDFAGDEEQLFDSELAIGEAIANSVEHATGALEVTINWRAERPTVTFQDTGAAFTFEGAPLLENSMSERGRGLSLIHALTSNVRVRYSDGRGMQLCFTLSVRKKASGS